MVKSEIELELDAAVAGYKRVECAVLAREMNERRRIERKGKTLLVKLGSKNNELADLWRLDECEAGL